VADSGQAAAGLPAWPEIKGSALRHLDAARNEISEVGNWLRSIDSPLTPAEARSAGEARKLCAQIKNLIDEAKGMLHG
jgi:hypothetical protein